MTTPAKFWAIQSLIGLVATEAVQTLTVELNYLALLQRDLSPAIRV